MNASGLVINSDSIFDTEEEREKGKKERNRLNSRSNNINMKEKSEKNEFRILSLHKI